MKTRLMTSVHARRMATSLVLVAALVGSGATLGTATDDEPIDAATQAAWLAEHFDCEYGTEVTETVAIDAATQATWLAEHFDCEYGTHMAGGEPIDAATQAAWLAEHFDCEYGTEMEEA